MCPDIVCYKYSDYASYHYYNVTDDLLSLFDKKNDLRYRFFLTPYEWYGNSEDDYGMRFVELMDDSRGIKKGEIYITEAEMALRKSTPDVDAALSSLNALRVKRTDNALYEPIIETDLETLMKIVLEERRRELMCSGLRWNDLKRLNREERWKKTIIHESIDGTFTLEPNSPRYVLRIPQSVIQVNPSIIQNP